MEITKGGRIVLSILVLPHLNSERESQQTSKRSTIAAVLRALWYERMPIFPRSSINLPGSPLEANFGQELEVMQRQNYST